MSIYCKNPPAFARGFLHKISIFEQNIFLYTFINIYKKRPWNSNQRYYVIEYYDRKSNENHYMNIHIPSKMQGRQRTVIELIKSNNIVENML